MEHDTIQMSVNECESGEIGRRTRLRIWRSNPWGFKSPLSHHLSLYSKTNPSTYTESDSMSQQNPPTDQPTLKLANTEDYRDGYANSVQVRMSVWDFFLVFGTMLQDKPDEVTVRNFQGIYVSPQQAKALWNVLGHNLAQYEQTFGQITLEQLPQADGPVN
jgi:hypothetical protein